MRYDFDEVIDRRNTNSVKYDTAEGHGCPPDVLPLWLADMDFRAPAPVLEELRRMVDHGIFGYGTVGKAYDDAVVAWFSDRFGWRTEPEWMVRTSGVVYAINTAIRALTEPGDAVLIQPPVYHPFFSAVKNNGRTLAESPLVCENGRYAIDFADFERKLVERQVKLFILCSPHNPVGRVWTEEELRRIGALCKKHGVLVISDEIHCDFTYDGHPHHTFLTVNPELAGQTVICTAPSKTFNLAGLQASNIWIPDEDLRRRFQAEMEREGASGPNVLGMAACRAAYACGGEWLDQCLAYLQGNAAFVRDHLSKRIPQVRLTEAEGTYFAWLDFTALGLDREALNDFLVHKAKIWLNSGHIFGAGGEGFQRMVLACPRSTLQRALEQLEQAVRELNGQQ